MNKRARDSVNPRVAALEKELQADSYAKQMSFSVETGRDVQTDLTTGQRRLLNATSLFMTRQGFRRRHPLHALSNYAGLMKTNVTPKTRYEQFMQETNERTQLPEIVKKSRNEFSPNQVGLVETATANFAKSKQKLSALIPISM